MAFAELCGPSAPEGWIFSDELLTVYERSQVLSDISCAEPQRTECLSLTRETTTFSSPTVCSWACAGGGLWQIIWPCLPPQE